MQIQLNTDKNFVGSPQLFASVERVLEQELKHVCDELTRIEVHLNDENSDKSGDADKRCLLEARPRGLPPIAVEHRASSVELAIRGAAGQLDRAVRNALGKLREGRQRGEPIKRIDLDAEL